METWLTTELSRTITTYICQAVLGLLLFFVFRYFYRIYQRPFLQTWAWSWVAFITFMLSTAIISFMGINQSQGGLRFSLTLLSTFASLAHAGLVLAGTLELSNKWTCSRKQFLYLFIAITLVSLVMVFAYSSKPEDREIRYVIRIGVKYMLTGVAFVLAGTLTFRNRLITRGIGQKVLASGFVLYGVLNFYYVFTVAFNIFIGATGFPIFFGLMELTMICMVGIGMVMWLLQDERDKLKKSIQS